jgi:hypothetical protein
MEGHVQQLNVKFLNLPQPDPAVRFVEKAARAVALSRNWASEARAVGLPDLLLPAAGSDLRALLASIDTRRVLDPEAHRLMASVIEACSAALAAAPAGVQAGERRLENILARRDALLQVLFAVDEALDLAAALRAGCDLAAR